MGGVHVVCRCCNGKGSYSPQYGEVLVLLQSLLDDDREALQGIIDDLVRNMASKRQKHSRKLLQDFCNAVDKYTDCKPIQNKAESQEPQQ